MSGVGRGLRRSDNLLVLSSLSSSLGQRRSGIKAEVNLLVKEAVFVPDDQPGFRVVLRDGEPEPASIPGDIEDEIRRVGLARSERRIEWRGKASCGGAPIGVLREYIGQQKTPL